MPGILAAVSKKLSIQALAGREPVSRLSVRNHVSRKFVYQQARRPVLVGADVRSTYCYLLAFVAVQEDHFAVLAERFAVPPLLVQKVAQLEALDPNRPASRTLAGTAGLSAVRPQLSRQADPRHAPTLPRATPVLSKLLPQTDTF